MNPYYAVPPAPLPPQQQQQQPKVSLDDLFGGPSSPAQPPQPPPLPPSYDALGGSGYGVPAAPPHNAYAAPPPPQQQQQQQQSGVPQAPVQGYPPAPGSPYGAPSSVPASAPPQKPQQEPYYNGASAMLQSPPPPPPSSSSSQMYAPPVQPAVPHSSPSAAPVASAAPAEEEDERAQLERIIRLRRELEQEQEREQRKKEELQTWGCTVCTFRNKLGVVKCEMCDTMRPGYAVAPATPLPASTTPAAPPLPRAGVTAWQCGMCLAPNDASAERCKVCYAYRSSGTPVPTATATAGSGVVSNTPFTTRWRCSVCGEVNAPSSAHCKICHGFQRNGTPVVEEGDNAGRAPRRSSNNNGGGGGDPPLPPTWACSVCTFENPTSVAICTACESGQRPRHLAPKRDKEKGHGSSSGANKSKEKEKKEGKLAEKQWPCPTCTFENPMGRKKCDMCGAKRPEKYADDADTAEARADARIEAQDDEEEIEWQDDNSVTECNNCHTTFTFLIRRHHCRLCGYVFCASCSSYVMSLKEGSFPQRVCVNCYKARKEMEKKMNKGRKWLEDVER